MPSEKGIVCEVDEQTIKLFCLLQHKIKSQANCFSNNPPKLGEFWRLHCGPSAKKLSLDSIHEDHLKFSVNQENVLLAETWAITPSKDDIPEEMWVKYGGKIWSRFLGFLSDPEKLFVNRYEPRQRGSILVQYAPTKDTVFKIVGISDVEYPAFVMKGPAPWETSEVHTPWEDVIHDEPRKARCLKHKFVRYALCIATKQRNLAHQVKRHGSPYYCDHLFTAKYGLVRSLYKIEKGQWYQHAFSTIHDRDSYEKPYWVTCAKDVIPVAAPLPTTVVGGNVEITTSFTFNHDTLEGTESRGITSWRERSLGIKKDAHFVDTYLGKVEIYPNQAVQIIKLVESLHQDFFYSRKDELITVAVTVRPLKTYFRNNNTYPRHGLFTVHEVIDVNYEEE